jgi:hypothetical protein
MLVMKGGSTGFNGAARPAEAVRQARRPWAETGSMPVDLLLTWAIVEQRAGNAVAGLFEAEVGAAGLTRRNRTLLAEVEQIAQLGCRIDVSGGVSDAVHPAADAVVAVLAAHERGARMVHCARCGPPGGWAEPARWMMPERWTVPGEEAMWCYVERTAGRHCPLVRVTSWEAIEAARGEYAGWWDDLGDVAWALSERALGFAVTGPSVVREPWAVA